MLLTGRIPALRTSTRGGKEVRGVKKLIVLLVALVIILGSCGGRTRYQIRKMMVVKYPVGTMVVAKQDDKKIKAGDVLYIVKIKKKRITLKGPRGERYFRVRGIRSWEALEALFLEYFEIKRIGPGNK